MSEIKVTAHLSDGIQATANLGRIVEVPVGPDIYTGDYTVTAPSDGDLVLPTKDNLMEEDVTIKANHEIEDALLTGDFTSDVYYNDRVTKIRPNAFYGFDAKVINLPNLSFNVSEVPQGIVYTLAEEIYTPRMYGRAYNNFYRYNENLRILDIGKVLIPSFFTTVQN